MRREFVEDTSEDLNNRDEEDPLLQNNQNIMNKENKNINQANTDYYKVCIQSQHSKSSNFRGRLNSADVSDVCSSGLINKRQKKLVI